MSTDETHGASDDHQTAPLSWAALLAQCTELAQAAVALPPGDPVETTRWQQAVPAIIELHALTHALTEIDRIADVDRPGTLDRAELLCRSAASALHRLWQGDPLPSSVAELIDDARVAFEAAANAGVEWVVRGDRLIAGHPGELRALLEREGFAGELFVPTPGVPIFRGAPAAFARAPGGAPPSEAVLRHIGQFLGQFGKPADRLVGEPERIALPRQVYRQFDFAKGGPVRDIVVPMNEPLPPGQPLLVLAVEAGASQPVPLPPTRPIQVPPLPVVIGVDDDEPADA